MLYIVYIELILMKVSRN